MALDRNDIARRAVSHTFHATLASIHDYFTRLTRFGGLSRYSGSRGYRVAGPITGLKFRGGFGLFCPDFSLDQPAAILRLCWRKPVRPLSGWHGKPSSLPVKPLLPFAEDQNARLAGFLSGGLRWVGSYRLGLHVEEVFDPLQMVENLPLAIVKPAKQRMFQIQRRPHHAQPSKGDFLRGDVLRCLCGVELRELQIFFLVSHRLHLSRQSFRYSRRAGTLFSKALSSFRGGFDGTAAMTTSPQQFLRMPAANQIHCLQNNQ
ncbi:hypothetical protein PMI11_05203 [Rhizobium sp. CF142]|nr:hypothetical protein PMI11_05203 [Rhizobium sp. CF142]